MMSRDPQLVGRSLRVRRREGYIGHASFALPDIDRAQGLFAYSKLCVLAPRPHPPKAEAFRAGSLREILLGVLA